MGEKKLAPSNDILLEIAYSVQRVAGVQFREKEKTLLKTRILKRARDLKLNDLGEYYEFWKGNREAEAPHLLSLLTTHHTYFFREFPQFEFLKSALPQLVKDIRSQGRKQLRAWSAASSSGEEAYSLAMWLHHHVASIDPNLEIRIFGTDVDPKSVSIAANGVYRWTQSERIPQFLLNRYCVRGTGELTTHFKVTDELRKKCSFHVLSLTDLKSDVAQSIPDHQGNFDLIFCRNVFIYFPPAQIEKVTLDLLERLTPTGYLMLGLSESLPAVPADTEALGSSIFRRRQNVKKKDTTPLPVTEPTILAIRPPAERLRVLCVDDSPTVLTLLKRILTSSEGFEVVGVAANGREAYEFLKSNKVDAITLDIHMPEVNGIDFLKNHYLTSYGPVIMVSSVARDDANLALKALELGAADYVEKPTLESFNLVAEQIRSKLRFAASLHKAEMRPDYQINKAFAKTLLISSTDVKASVWVMPLSRFVKNRAHFDSLSRPQPPVLVFLSEGETMLDQFQDNQWAIWKSGANLLTNRRYIILKKDLESVLAQVQGRRVHFLVTSDVLQNTIDGLRSLRPAHWIVEDAKSTTLKNVPSPIVVPFTSFAYESDRRFSEDNP